MAFKEHIQDVIKQAQKKGLKVTKNTFAPGWSISIPGGCYHATSDADMIDYVKGY